MSNVVEFKRQVIDNVQKALEEALTKDFEQIWIVGTKDGDIHLTQTGGESMVYDLGVLEALKDYLLKNWH